jgi:hypothetical protein
MSKFIILSRDRSGSTFLMDLLDAHSDIKCAGELLYLRNDFWLDIENDLLKAFVLSRPVSAAIRRFPAFYLEARRLGYGAKHFGLKIFIDHVKRPHLAIPKLHRQGWRWIYLQRQDILAQSLSLMTSIATKNWHRNAEEPVPQVTVKLDVDQFMARIRRGCRFLKRELDAIERVPHVKVSYEEDLCHAGRREKKLDEIFDWIGVSRMNVKSRYAPVYDKPYREIVENYDELVAAVRASQYASVLESVVEP